MKKRVFCLLIFIGFATQFKQAFCFSECSGSGLADPSINNVNNCSTWATYFESNGGNFQNECLANSSLAIKCCFTCTVYTKFKSNCMDDLTECKVKPSNTQCNNIQSTFHTVGYYCPYSCNLCSTQNCQFFEGICGNFGTCSEVTYFGLQTIECSCNSGYFGANCNIPNTCWTSAVNPCKYGSACIGSSDADVLYTCSCINGCKGKNCDQNCNCLAGGNFSCQNGGFCIIGGVCKCQNNYSGSHCEQFIGGCVNTSCMNGGVCNKINGICNCEPVFIGKTCETFIGCLAGIEFSWLTGKFDCQNGGFCVNSSGMGICNCQTGFSGTYCEASSDYSLTSTSIAKFIQTNNDTSCSYVSCYVPVTFLCLLIGVISIIGILALTIYIKKKKAVHSSVYVDKNGNDNDLIVPYHLTPNPFTQFLNKTVETSLQKSYTISTDDVVVQDVRTAPKYDFFLEQPGSVKSEDEILNKSYPILSLSVKK